MEPINIEFPQSRPRMSGDQADKAKQANIVQFKEIAQAYENSSTELMAKVAAQSILQFDPQSKEVATSPQIVRSKKAEISHEELDLTSTTTDNVNHHLWGRKQPRVLDFACGTGLVSKNLSPYAKKIIGVDISSDMILHYNAKKMENAEAHVIDVTKTHDLEKQGLVKDGFDAIVSSLAYHHIYDCEGTTVRLAELLTKGGYLYVVDTDVGSGSFHGTMTDKDCDETGTPYRYGMEADHLAKMFEDAGLVNVKVVRSIRTRSWLPQRDFEGATGLTGITKKEDDILYHEQKMDLILAVGQKP